MRSPINNSRSLVNAAQTINLPRADGAFGRRHLSRGLWGFYNPPSKKTREMVAELVRVPGMDDSPVPPHGQFIGFKLIKHG
jgi:hypothetical protein